jgi:uncharacterized protein YecA (UPF0149 family)/tetratricopeptide (TPR) repeat protein
MFEENIDIAMRRLMDGESLDDFCDWFVKVKLTEPAVLQGMPDVPLADLARSLRHVARQFWGQMPYPSNRWRARGLPKTERNGPCHCGSGRKFKQCCAEFEHAPLALTTESLQVLALEHAAPEWLTGDKLREVPALALGHAAMGWNDAGEQERTIRLLGPMFVDLKALDERHEVAFDAYVEALMDHGQEHERRDLIDRMAQHPNKDLATTARGRLVSILADQGEMDQAWQLFQETSRFNPNDPQLWHLELSLLLAQGRQEEARLRAPLLAARARKVGMDDLAEVLVGMAEDGMGFLRDAAFDKVIDQYDASLISLTDAVPQQLDDKVLHSLYAVEVSSHGEGDARVDVAWVEPVKKMIDLYRRWQRTFVVGKPDMTWLNGDVDSLIEGLPEAQLFLEKNPQAWYSADVLDDLLMAALTLCDDESPAPVLDGVQRLAHHAVSVLRSLAAGAQIHWAVQAHRPMLRCLAMAVELAQMRLDETAAIDDLNFGLALNPNDNHGWRTVLATLLMERGDYQDAVNLMDRYPNDMPPADHRRALALFNLGRKAEAATVLREAHSAHPLYFMALLPKVMDAPPVEDERGYALGGAEAAWHFRIECRHLWVATGALAWGQGLQLPEPLAVKPKKPAKAPQPAPSKKAGGKAGGAAGVMALGKDFSPKQEKLLRKICSDYPRLHGFLQAVAWSPQVLMPNAWIGAAMDMHDLMPNSRTEATAKEALHDAVEATMALCNHQVQTVMDDLGNPQLGLDEVRAVVGHDESAALSWAAGFFQGSETAAAAWARHGHKVVGVTGTFGRLRGLAVRAELLRVQSHVQNDQGKPNLQVLSDQPAAWSDLQAALHDLWPVVRQARLAGMHPG